MKINYAVMTDAGKVRSHNEDNFYVDKVTRQDVQCSTMQITGTSYDCEFLAAVCDGMGGEKNGEYASLEAVNGLVPLKISEVKKSVGTYVRTINQRICEAIINDDGKRRGSTLVALYIDDGKAICCNVGDSRGYLVRNGMLRKLSQDHNKAAMLVQLGLMTEEEARKKGYTHELTQHLGIFEDEMIVEPYISEEIELQEKDIFLLCSDGVTDMLTEENITEIINGEADAQAMVERLVEQALINGGRDNVTAVVLLVH